MSIQPLTFGSLFSGIGGFDLGFERAGMVCSWQCEIDAAAASVLSRHWPNVPRQTDVRTIGAHNLESVDVVCGGFPCQDVSVAGSRAGLAGERSGLWHEFHRVLGEMRPRWCVIENVPGLLSSNRGRDFAVILRGLVKLGYGVTYRILDAQYFGVAQRRRRVFIVGSLGDGRSAKVLFESASLPGHPAPSRATRQDVAGTLGGSSQSGGFQTTDLDNTGAFIPLVARSLTTSNQRIDAETETFILQHAQINRKDEAGPQGKGWQQNIAFTMDSRPTADVIAFTSKDYGGDAGELSPTLRSLNFDKSHMNGGGQVAIAYGITENQRSEVRLTDVVGSLTSGGGKPGQGYSAVQQSTAVRRLTPTECERLQGFPDGHTAGQADSSRYRQLGNAVAVPVATWLGRRIVEAS